MNFILPKCIFYAAPTKWIVNAWRYSLVRVAQAKSTRGKKIYIYIFQQKQITRPFTKHCNHSHRGNQNSHLWGSSSIKVIYKPLLPPEFSFFPFQRQCRIYWSPRNVSWEFRRYHSYSCIAFLSFLSFFPVIQAWAGIPYSLFLPSLSEKSVSKKQEQRFQYSKKL